MNSLLTHAPESGVGWLSMIKHALLQLRCLDAANILRELP